MPGKWQYDHETAEWSRHYSPTCYAVLFLRSGQWHGRLVVGGTRVVTGDWKQSKFAKLDLDKAQREHAAATNQNQKPTSGVIAGA